VVAVVVVVNHDGTVLPGCVVVPARCRALAMVVVMVVRVAVVASQGNTSHRADPRPHHGAIAATDLVADHTAEHAAQHRADHGIAATRRGGLCGEGNQQQGDESDTGHFHGDDS
jgi:hypothetical protein